MFFQKSLTSRLPLVNYDAEPTEDREVQRKKEVDDLISKYAKKKDSKDEVSAQFFFILYCTFLHEFTA